VGDHGVFPDYTSLLDLEDDPGNDGTIRDPSGTEGEDGTVLFVLGIVA